MTGPATLPYRTTTADAVTLGPWQIETDDGRDILEAGISGWDYLAPIRLSRSYSIDTERVRDDTRLSPSSVVRVSVTATCPAARYRECVDQSARMELDGETVQGRLRVDLDSSELCAAFTLSTELVLAATNEPSRFVASLSGSRLFQDTISIQLEGNAGRFPMSTCDFANDLSSLQIPRAKWYLWRGQTDYAAPVSQALMLYLNSAHSEIVAAVAENDTKTLEFISSDVARQLVAIALDDEDFEIDHELYPDNSVGHAMCGLVLACFPGKTKDQIIKLRESHPGKFEAMIQSAVV